MTANGAADGDGNPRHIDPAGDLADDVESGELDVELADNQDAGELRDLLDRAEAGEGAEGRQDDTGQ